MEQEVREQQLAFNLSKPFDVPPDAANWRVSHMKPIGVPQAAAQVCRTLLTALGATTVELLAAPTVQTSPDELLGVPPEQLIDLSIAKLRSALSTGTQVAAVRPLNFHLVRLPRRS